uniref:Uncharacterized protein n=1 Tax=Romanomermis culicivorax TaxID=13658 RepID=A0A915JUT6_ROMCU
MLLNSKEYPVCAIEFRTFKKPDLDQVKRYLNWIAAPYSENINANRNKETKTSCYGGDQCFLLISHYDYFLARETYFAAAICASCSSRFSSAVFIVKNLSTKRFMAAEMTVKPNRMKINQLSMGAKKYWTTNDSCTSEPIAMTAKAVGNKPLVQTNNRNAVPVVPPFRPVECIGAGRDDHGASRRRHQNEIRLRNLGPLAKAAFHVFQYGPDDGVQTFTDALEHNQGERNAGQSV